MLTVTTTINSQQLFSRSVILTLFVARVVPYFCGFEHFITVSICSCFVTISSPIWVKVVGAFFFVSFNLTFYSYHICALVHPLKNYTNRGRERKRPNTLRLFRFDPSNCFECFNSIIDWNLRTHQRQYIKYDINLCLMMERQTHNRCQCRSYRPIASFLNNGSSWERVCAHRTSMRPKSLYINVRWLLKIIKKPQMHSVAHRLLRLLRSPRFYLKYSSSSQIKLLGSLPVSSNLRQLP